MPLSSTSFSKESQEPVSSCCAKGTVADHATPSNIPWAAVFSFLRGKDIARALTVANNDASPWQLSGDVASALKRRLEATEEGNDLLRRYPRDDMLPKLLHCSENGSVLRFDSIFYHAIHLDDQYETLKFYPNGKS